MKNNVAVKIVVAESSVIIRSGLTAVLKRLPNLHIHPVEVSTLQSLQLCLRTYPVDIVLVNPSFGGWLDLPALKATLGRRGVRFVAVVCSVTDNYSLRQYDDHFTVCDDLDVISEKINRLLHADTPDSPDEGRETLSQREKEIVTCVVKGMTNKEIASRLFLSIHTVITHRRNIARKLQIHSPAGLAIYALAGKLVSLDEVR